MKTEKEMREYEVSTPETMAALVKEISGVVDMKHDYGTCVYAMSIAAVAAFRFVAHKLGVTGFQASCADLDFLGRIRHMKHGFKILNYNDLLYPQYADKFTMTFSETIKENIEMLGPIAKKNLVENEHTHEDVIKHWKIISDVYDQHTEEKNRDKSNED